MKKQIITMFLLFVTCQFAWGAVTNIYSDTTIGSGVYDTVNIYDSLDVPPVQTTVDMTGGEIDSCHVYDTAILNFEGGNIFLVTSHNNSNVTINSVPSPDVFELYDNSEIYLQNGDYYTTVQIFDDAVLHIYGYNFDYDPSITGTNAVNGFWGNGEALRIALRSTPGVDYDPYTQVVLHEIPEPTTFLLFTFGSLLFRRHYKHLNLKS